MLFEDIDVFDKNSVKGYFLKNYPKACAALRDFNLSSAEDINAILKLQEPGQQITFHAFPGSILCGNAYVFPRFMRVVAIGPNLYQVTREKAVRERVPARMSSRDVIQYYFELADVTFLQSELEIGWGERWPSESKRN